MTNLNRRDFILGSAALAALALFAVPAFAGTVDVTELNKPPELGDMILGNPDSKVTVIEYASASCPHCAAFYNDVFPQFKKEYIDTKKIRFIFREWPHNDPALIAFMIARSVPKDAYFPLIDVLFKTQKTWFNANVVNGQFKADGLADIAKQVGISKDAFDALMKNEDLAKKIIAIRDGGEKFGVTGIPTFFINGEMLDGEQKIEDLKAKIDPLLG